MKIYKINNIFKTKKEILETNKGYLARYKKWYQIHWRYIGTYYIKTEYQWLNSILYNKLPFEKDYNSALELLENNFNNKNFKIIKTIQIF